MAGIILNAIPDWFQAVEVIDIQDPRLHQRTRLSSFQVVFDDTLPLFFRVAEGPDSPYINLKKFMDIVGRVITSPEDGTNKRIKTVHINSAKDNLVIEYVEEN